MPQSPSSSSVGSGAGGDNKSNNNNKSTIPNRIKSFFIKSTSPNSNSSHSRISSPNSPNLPKTASTNTMPIHIHDSGGSSHHHHQQPPFNRKSSASNGATSSVLSSSPSSQHQQHLVSSPRSLLAAQQQQPTNHQNHQHLMVSSTSPVVGNSAFTPPNNNNNYSNNSTSSHHDIISPTTSNIVDDPILFHSPPTTTDNNNNNSNFNGSFLAGNEKIINQHLYHEPTVSSSSSVVLTTTNTDSHHHESISGGGTNRRMDSTVSSSDVGSYHHHHHMLSNSIVGGNHHDLMQYDLNFIEGGSRKTFDFHNMTAGHSYIGSLPNSGGSILQQQHQHHHHHGVSSIGQATAFGSVRDSTMMLSGSLLDRHLLDVSNRHHDNIDSISQSSIDSARSTPHVNIARLGQHHKDSHSSSHFNDAATTSDEASGTTAEDTQSSHHGVPMNVDEIFQAHAVENNPTISMTGYADTYLSSFSKIKSSLSEDENLFALQCLPNIFQPLYYRDDDNSAYGFSEIKKAPLLSHLSEQEVSELPPHARRTIKHKYESPFLVLLSNSKKQHHLSRTTLKKFSVNQTKKQVIEDTKWRMFEEAMLAKEVRFHNDPNTSSTNTVLDYILPSGKTDKPRNRSDSGGLLPLKTPLELGGRSTSPTTTTGGAGSPTIIGSPLTESMFRRKHSDSNYASSPNTTDDTSSLSSMKGYDSSSEEEESFQMSNFSPRVIQEIPQGFLSTKLELLKEYMKETSEENSNVSLKKNATDYKTWKKEHALLEFLSDDLMNTHELKTKLFPFMYTPNENLKDGSSDILLQNFFVNKQDVENRAKLIIDVDKFKLDFVEEHLSGVPLENFYASLTLYSVKLTESQNPTISAVKRYSETFSFSLSSSTGSKRALFYLSSQNLPNSTVPNTEKVFVLLRIFRNFKGTYADNFNELYIKGKHTPKSSSDKPFNINDSKDYKAIKAVKPSFFESLKDVYSAFAWSIVELNPMLNSLPALQFPSLYVNGEGLSNDFNVRNIYSIPDKLVGNVSDDKLFEIYFANGLNLIPNVAEVSSGESGISGLVSGDKTLVVNSGKDIIKQLSKSMLRSVPSKFTFKLMLLLPSKANQIMRSSLFENEKQYQYVQRKYLPENNMLVIQKESVTDQVEKKKKNRDESKETLQADLPVSEMEQFYSSNTMPESTNRQSCLRNELYIYPQSANFSKFSVKNKNIQITVSYNDTDQNFSLNNMEQRNKGLFYKPFTGNNTSGRINEGECVSVALKNEKPEFSDEIKCIIPCRYPTEEEDCRQHLVFKFYNVSHKETIQKSKATEVELSQSRTLIGVAFLMVYKKVTTTIDKKKIALKDLIKGDFDLPVYPVLNIPNSNYLRLCDQVIDPSLAHIKPSATFKVKIVPHSFILPNIALTFPYSTSNIINLFLLKFFRLVNNTSKPSFEEIADVYKTLIQTYEYEKQVVSNTIWFEMHALYLPLILNTCFEWIIDTFGQDKTYTTELWKIILFFIEKYNQHSTSSSTVLKIYQKYHFRFSKSGDDVIFKLISSFIDSVKMENSKLSPKGNVFEELFLRNNQTIFGLFLKCIVCSMSYNTIGPFQVDNEFDNLHILTKSSLNAIEQFTVMVLEMVERVSFKNEKHTTLKSFLKSFATFYSHIIAIYSVKSDKRFELAGLISKQEIIQYLLKFIESMGYLPSLYKLKNNENQSDSKKSKEISVLVSEAQLLMISELLLYFPSFELSLPPPISLLESIVSQTTDANPISNFRDIHHFVFSSFAEYFVRTIYLSEDKEVRLKAILLFKEYVEKISRECNTVQLSEDSQVDEQKVDMRSRIYTSQLLLEFFAKHMIEIFPEWKRNAESNQKKITAAIDELRRKISQVDRDMIAAQDSLNQAKQNKAKKSVESEKKLTTLEVQLTTLKQLLITKEKQLLEEFEITKTEKRMLLSIFIQTMTNCEETTLRSLWKIKPSTEDDSNMYHDDGLHFSLKLLMIFQMCVQSFEYGGYSPLYHHYDRLYQKLPQYQNVKHSTPLNDKFSPAKSNPSIATISNKKKGDDKPLTKMSLDGVSTDVDSPVRSSPLPTQNSGISQSDYIEKKISVERLISSETSAAIFQFFLKFMEDNASFIQNVVRPGTHMDPKHLPPILDNIIRTLLNLLRSNLCETLTISVLLYLRNILSQHPFTSIFYNPQSEYGLLFSEELLRLSHSKLGSVRKHAAACFYLWIRFCFEENKGMTVPQIMVTLSLSRRLQSYTKITHNFLSDKTIGDESFDDSEGINALAHIEECIKLLPYFAIKDEAAPGSKFFKIRNKYGNQKGDMTDRDQTEQKGFHTAMVFFKKIENKADHKKFGQKVLEILDQFHDLLSDLSKKLLSLVQDTMAIRATMIKRKQSETSTVTYDPFKTEELLYRISDNYSKLPELRLAWLEQLASYHKGLGQYEESAHCYLRILSLVFDYLDNQAAKRFSPNSKTEVSLLEILPLNQFYSISPMLIEFKVNQTGIQTQSLLGGGNSKYDYMSDQSIVNYILKTIDSLELSECYEHCIMLYKLLIPIFESKYANFTQLHTIYDRLTQLYKKCSSFQSTSNSSTVPKSPSDNEANNTLSLSTLSSLSAPKSTENETDSRVYSFYYRVKFVGKAFGELDGKVYIYKMPKLFKLFKMKNKMLEIYGKDVEVVSKDEAGVVTADDELSSGSETNKKIIQINHVKPFLPTAEQLKILRKKFDDLNRLSNISTGVNSAPSTRGLDKTSYAKTILKKNTLTSSTSKLPTMVSDSLSPRNRSNSNSQQPPPLQTLRSNIKFKSDENLAGYNTSDTDGNTSPTSPRRDNNTSSAFSPKSPSKITIPKLNLSKNKSTSSISQPNHNAFQDMERFLYDKILTLNYFITRDSEFQRNMNLDHFFYEYSVAAKGADITQTYKKKILITTEEYFPNVMTRLPVAEEREFTLSPIENSIEMIDTQVKKLESAMNLVLSTALGDVSNYTVLGNMFNHSVHTSSHTNSGSTGTPTYNKRHSIKGTSNLVINLNMTNSLGSVPYFNDLNINPHTVSTLQMILQGSVQARVGEGPKKVVEIFLNKNFREQWKFQQGNSELISKLNERCFRFLLLCDRGVKLHSLIIHSQAPTATNGKDRILHTELEKGFLEVKTLFEGYLEIPTVRTFVPVVNGSIAPERVTNMKKGQETVETFITVTVQDDLNYPDLFYKHNNISYNTLQNLKIGKQQLTDPFKQISTPSESPRNADLLTTIRNNNRLSIPSIKMKEYLEQLSIPSSSSSALGKSLMSTSDSHLLRQASLDLQ